MQASTQVLVVGAGPVGLLAAVYLRDEGFDVTVIDQEEQRAARSYAVVLHPSTLRALGELGIDEPVLWQGHSLTRLAVYADSERRAVLDLSPSGVTDGAGQRRPGGLTLPQNVLRDALQEALASRGVPIHFRQRLVSLEQDGRGVSARIARRELLKLGSPAWLSDWADGEICNVRADYVVGADGYESVVRSALGVEFVRHGPTQAYAFFDVAREAGFGIDAAVVLSDDFSDAMYALHAGVTRWSFQLASALNAELGAARLRNLLQARMPWHPADIEKVEWSGIAEFQSALVERWGRNRVWLIGDAAHATSPLGVQSLNVGLAEARELSRAILASHGAGSTSALEHEYAAGRQRTWTQLLNLDASPHLRDGAEAWARKYAARLVPCLPASGQDLDQLLEPMGIQLD